MDVNLRIIQISQSVIGYVFFNKGWTGLYIHPMDTYAQRSDMYNATKYLYNPQKETNAYMKKSIATIENITTQFVFFV